MPTADIISRREFEVLLRCSQGLSNDDIAQALHITVGTTKGHLYRIYRKLDVKRRTAAVMRARQLGILAP